MFMGVIVSSGVYVVKQKRQRQFSYGVWHNYWSVTVVSFELFFSFHITQPRWT